MMQKLPLAWKRNQQEMVACYLPSLLVRVNLCEKSLGAEEAWTRKRFLCLLRQSCSADEIGQTILIAIRSHRRSEVKHWVLDSVIETVVPHSSDPKGVSYGYAKKDSCTDRFF